MELVIIIIFGTVALFILQPLFIVICSKPCYRVRRIEYVHTNGCTNFYFRIEQMHKILSFVWWGAIVGRCLSRFNNLDEAENYIKHLLSNEKQTISNVICKDSPNTKVKFD